MKNLCVKLVYLQRLTVHVCLVNFRDVLSVTAATSFAFTSLTAHFPKPFFTSLIEQVTPFAEGRIFYGSLQNFLQQ